MTIETEPARERLRPRHSVETEETGRLELKPAAGARDPTCRADCDRPIPVSPRRRSDGLGDPCLSAVIGIDLVQFVDGAFAHGTGLGVAAATAVVGRLRRRSLLAHGGAARAVAAALGRAAAKPDPVRLCRTS